MTKLRAEDLGAVEARILATPVRPPPPQDRQLIDAWLYERWPAAFGLLPLPIDPKSFGTIRRYADPLPAWAGGLAVARAKAHNTHFRTLTEIAKPRSCWHSLRGLACRVIGEDERAVAAAEVARLKALRS